MGRDVGIAELLYSEIAQKKDMVVKQIQITTLGKGCPCHLGGSLYTVRASAADTWNGNNAFSDSTKTVLGYREDSSRIYPLKT